MTVKRVRQIADSQDQRRDDRSIITGYSYFCMLYRCYFRYALYRV